MADHICRTDGCGGRGTHRDDPEIVGDQVLEVWWCDNCHRIRVSLRINNEGYRTTALDGIIHPRAVEGTTADGHVEPHGYDWHWLPYINGRKLDNPIHVKRARPVTYSGKGQALKRKNIELDLQSLAARLTPEQREPLLLQVLEGLSYAVIAAQLGVTITTVRERLRAARARLRILQGA